MSIPGGKLASVLATSTISKPVAVSRATRDRVADNAGASLKWFRNAHAMSARNSASYTNTAHSYAVAMSACRLPGNAIRRRCASREKRPTEPPWQFGAGATDQIVRHRPGLSSRVIRVVWPSSPLRMSLRASSEESATGLQLARSPKGHRGKVWHQQSQYGTPGLSAACWL
jgi:hypothetical protein